MSYIPTPQGVQEQTVKFYNPTLETFKCQCDSKVFRFSPKEYTEVPFSLMYILEKQLADYGVFIVYPTMTQDDIKKKEFECLKHYKDNGVLKARIVNFFAYVDEMKKRGMTIDESPEMKRALRMKKEIEILLKENKHVDIELSFFDDVQRKEYGLEVDNAQYVGSKLPDIEEVKQDGVQVVEKKQVGRPKKVVDSYLEA